MSEQLALPIIGSLPASIEGKMYLHWNGHRYVIERWEAGEWKAVFLSAPDEPIEVIWR